VKPSIKERRWGRKAVKAQKKGNIQHEKGGNECRQGDVTETA
jgi:hypothetical protein